MQANDPIYPSIGTRLGHTQTTGPGLSVRDHMLIEFTKAMLSNPRENETSSKCIREFLDIPDGIPYEFHIHYPIYVAKMASLYADAVTNQSNK